MSKEDAWMMTFTGKRFTPFEPNIDDICIEDIAHHLALETRYGGACKYHYSVAQHCVLGAYQAPLELKLPFLLHDGAEAYLKDILHNLKEYMPEYSEAEKALQELIYLKFEVPEFDRFKVKQIDFGMMSTEVDALMTSRDGWVFPAPPVDVGIHPWTWQEAEAMFLDAYYTYA